MAITDLIPWRFRSAAGQNSPYLPLQHELNHVLDEYFNNGVGNGRSDSNQFFPNVDVKESEDSVEVTAEIPGMTDKDIRLDLSRNGEALSIEGEKKTAREETKNGVYYSERRFGSFRRTISLPRRVDGENVEARYKDGVLHVSMKKSPDAEQSRRRIQIQSA